MMTDYERDQAIEKHLNRADAVLDNPGASQMDAIVEARVHLDFVRVLIDLANVR